MDQTINTANNINSIHDDNCEKCVIGTFMNDNEAFFDTYGWDNIYYRGYFRGCS